MVAIDDTASMTANKSGQMALEALTMISKLTQTRLLPDFFTYLFQHFSLVFFFDECSTFAKPCRDWK